MAREQSPGPSSNGSTPKKQQQPELLNNGKYYMTKDGPVASMSILNADFEGSFETETLAIGEPAEVHKTWVRDVWFGDGWPWWLKLGHFPWGSPVHEPTDEAGSGGVRVAPMFLWEAILPEKNVLGKVVRYTVIYETPFVPFEKHLGTVSFYPAGPGKTRVVWHVDYTFKKIAGFTHPLAASCYLGFFFITHFTDAVRRHSARIAAKKEKAQQKTKASWGLGHFALLALLVAYVAFMANRFVNLPVEPSYPPQPYLDVLSAYFKRTPEISDFVGKTSFLIIGGGGMTGSGIVHELRSRGAKKIKIMGRRFPSMPQFPYGPGKDSYYPLPGVEYVKGDLTNPETLAKAFEGVDVVFQTAVYYGVPTFGSYRGAEEADRINIKGMQTLYQVAKASKSVKQIIYTSSSDVVYTGRIQINVNETHPFYQHGDVKGEYKYAQGPYAVGDNYARTKAIAEKFLLDSDNQDGRIRTAALRPNGITGPGDWTATKKGIDPFWVLGAAFAYFDVNQRADWSCVSNLAMAHVLTSYKLETAPAKVGGKAYFVSDGYPISTAGMELFMPTIRILGLDKIPMFIPVPSSVILASAWGLENLEYYVHKFTGFSFPILSYKEGLKSVITDTHSIRRIQTDMGYEPLMTTHQCANYMAEEFYRRYTGKTYGEK